MTSPAIDQSARDALDDLGLVDDDLTPDRRRPPVDRPGAPPPGPEGLPN